MKIQLLIVVNDAPDENQFGHGLEIDLPEVPRTGEYIVLSRPDQTGTANFIVRAVHWALNYPDGKLNHAVGVNAVGQLDKITLECEVVLGSYSSEEHKQGSAL